MSWFSKSKEEKFIEENAEKLVDHLIAYCVAGAKEVVDGRGEQVPSNLNVNAIFLFLFSLRGTIEAQGIEVKLGKRAHQFILAEIERQYQAAFPESYSLAGDFSQSMMPAAIATMSASPDPREWTRIHAVQILGTKDPDDELFHLCLGAVLSNGQPIAALVEQEA